MASVSQFLEGGAIGILNNILSAFHSSNGYAQPNRYEVHIFGPRPNGGGLENANRGGVTVGVNGRDLSLRCSTITLPGINLATAQDANIYGPTRDVVEGVSYAETISMSFQSSSGLDERKYFEKWQKSAYNDTTWNLGYYNDYIGTVDIYLLDKQDEKRYGLRLREAYPKEINGIELSYGSNNEIITTTVGMSFRYWEPIDASGGSLGVADKILNTVRNTIERKISANIPKVLRRL